MGRGRSPLGPTKVARHEAPGFPDSALSWNIQEACLFDSSGSPAAWRFYYGHFRRLFARRLSTVWCLADGGQGSFRPLVRSPRNAI